MKLPANSRDSCFLQCSGNAQEAGLGSGKGILFSDSHELGTLWGIWFTACGLPLDWSVDKETLKGDELNCLRFCSRNRSLGTPEQSPGQTDKLPLSSQGPSRLTPGSFHKQRLWNVCSAQAPLETAAPRMRMARVGTPSVWHSCLLYFVRAQSLTAAQKPETVSRGGAHRTAGAVVTQDQLPGLWATYCLELAPRPRLPV